MTLIQYPPGRCCCGHYKNLEEDFIHNDYIHQLFGPEGNFCGPKDKHTIRFLESKIKNLEQVIKDYQTVLKRG